MTAPVITVEESTPLKEVARLLVEHRISGVPVVDDRGTVVGAVTEADFLVKEQGPDAVPRRRLAGLLGESAQSEAQLAKTRATTAGEAMTSPAVTTDPGRSIGEAARLMTARRVNRLPVLDGEELVGIVTRADIVRAYVRTDAELAETIREKVLRGALWLEPASFQVDVADGRVAIKGEVSRRSTVPMVERFVAMVPGVVDVTADIGWSIDDSEIEPPTKDATFPFSPG